MFKLRLTSESESHPVSSHKTLKQIKAHAGGVQLLTFYITSFLFSFSFGFGVEGLLIRLKTSPS